MHRFDDGLSRTSFAGSPPTLRGDEQIIDPIEVLWDGEVAVVVNKPAGLSTQAPPGADSLEVRLRSQFRDRGDYLAFPHRLDRPVSGVILVALRKRAARLLGGQFMSRKVQKDYIARVDGIVDESDSVWVDYIRKIKDQAKVELVSKHDELAKEARTAVEVMRIDEGSNCTWIKLSPVTGRMHQLRIQLASRGHPILGDRLYGDRVMGTHGDAPPPPDGQERIELRAHSLRFFDPRDSRAVTVTASENWADSV